MKSVCKHNGNLLLGKNGNAISRNYWSAWTGGYTAANMSDFLHLSGGETCRSFSATNGGFLQHYCNSITPGRADAASIKVEIKSTTWDESVAGTTLVARAQDGVLYLAGASSVSSLNIINFATYSTLNCAGPGLLVTKLLNGDIAWAHRVTSYGLAIKSACATNTGGLQIIVKTPSTSTGPITYRGETLIATPTPDSYYLVRIDAQGMHEASSIIGSGNITISKSKIDSLGNTYMAGFFYGSGASLAGHTFANSVDTNSCIFAIKLAPNMSVSWANQSQPVVDSGLDVIYADINDSGDMAICGGRRFYTPVLFNGDPLPVRFVIKIASDGTTVFIKSTDGTDTVSAWYHPRVALSSVGNVFLTNTYSGETVVGTTHIENHLSGNTGLFVAKWLSNGEQSWVRTADSTLDGSRSVWGLAVDEPGTVSVLGGLSDWGNLIFDSATMSGVESTTGYWHFMAKLRKA